MTDFSDFFYLLTLKSELFDTNVFLPEIVGNLTKVSLLVLGCCSNRKQILSSRQTPSL